MRMGFYLQRCVVVYLFYPFPFFLFFFSFSLCEPFEIIIKTLITAHVALGSADLHVK